MTDKITDEREQELSVLLNRLGINANTLTPTQRASALAALTNEGIDIIPTPAFVIKSTCLSVNTSSSVRTSPESTLPKNFAIPNGKVFINICYHDAIPPVKTAPKPLDKNNNSSNDDQPAVSIPIAVGPVKHDTDKEGQPVVVVDMIVHPSVTTDCERDGSGAFRHWLCQLAIQYLYKKHNILINNQYRFPILKYKGTTVTSQRVRKPNPSSTGIQEVRTTNTPDKKSNTTSSTTPSSSTTGVETITPLSVIAEAGGLPSISTALGPVQKGGASQAAPRRQPIIPQENIQMDIRVVGKDDDPNDKDIHTRINEDMQKQIDEQSSSSLQFTKDNNTPNKTSSTTPSHNGLQPVTSKRIYKPLVPIISVNIITTAIDSTVNTDSSSLSTYACTIVQDTNPPTISNPATKGATDPIKESLYYRTELPNNIAVNDIYKYLKSITVSVTFPEPNQMDQLPIRLNSKNIKLTMNGSGDNLLLSAEGYRVCSIRLPFRCNVITEEPEINSKNSMSPSSGPRVIPANYDTDFRMLTLRLNIRMDQSLILPTLPSVYEDTEYMRNILLQYIEAEKQRFEPDPGSKPWLLAQAFANNNAEDDTDNTKKSTSSSSVPNVSSSTRPLDDNTPVRDDEVLPEDAFLRQDALSLHYLRQREEDAKRRVEKENERNKQRGNQPYQEILPPGSEDDLIQELPNPMLDNPATLSNIGNTTNNNITNNNTIIKTFPEQNTSTTGAGVTTSVPAPIDPALLYDIL